jgi:hypothetical protein
MFVLSRYDAPVISVQLLGEHGSASSSMPKPQHYDDYTILP